MARRYDVGDDTIYADLHGLLEHLRSCLDEIQEKVGALTKGEETDDGSDDA